MSRRIVCRADEINEALELAQKASGEIFGSHASGTTDAEKTECLFFALRNLNELEGLLKNAEQLLSPSERELLEQTNVEPARSVVGGEATECHETGRLDWSDEVGTLLGRSLGEAMRMVTNELSTIIAAHQTKDRGYDETETWAALEQLRRRCGLAATWGNEQARDERRDSEMRVRTAPQAQAGAR